MQPGPDWKKISYNTGIVLFAAGTLDPLEGSVLIIAGSLLIAIVSHLNQNTYRKMFRNAAILICMGVFFLFYFSSLGGFGGNAKLSWWWATLIIPYPAGWFLVVGFLIKTRIAKKQPQIS